MHITRFDAAMPYEAPRHFGMTALRLHGSGAGPAKGASLGFSTFSAKGGAELSASAVDRIYFVLSGTITVTIAGEDHVLLPHDSCYIPAGEARALANNGTDPCEMLVFTVDVS